MSNKLTKLETKVNNQSRNPQVIWQRNQNQFRRPFNRQVLYKEIINKDPPIHPPVRENDVNHVICVPPHGEHIEPLDVLNWMHYAIEVINLTQNKYQRFLHEDVY